MPNSSIKERLQHALNDLKPKSFETQEDVDLFKNLLLEYVNHQDEIIDATVLRVEKLENNMEEIYADDITKMAGLMFIEHKGLEDEFQEFLIAKTIEITRNGSIQ